MTIKNKIRLSNILMLVIPLAVTMAAVLLGRCSLIGNYWHSIEAMYQDENGIQSAQSLIYTYQKELWEINWGDRAERDRAAGEIRQSDTMYYLEKKLTKMGYYFQVSKNGTVLYSNISDRDMEIAVKTAGDALFTAKSLTASLDHASVLKNTFVHEEKEFSIIAVNNGRERCQVESYFQTYIVKYVGILLAVFLGITMMVNGILSWWVSKSVLVPLKKLSQGTRQIREGNLDVEIDYHKNDEFYQVCQDFEKMRAYLKESVRQRVENENRRKEMINGVSHDLRTPLTSIGGYVDGLIEGIADTPQKEERYLKAIKRRAGDLERLVNSLSDYNRLENGQAKYHMERGDLKVFFEQYLSAYQEEAGQNHVEICLEAPDRAYPLLFDGSEMKRVVDNLFTNTIRYRTDIPSKVWIRISKKQQQDRIRIEFQDDGPGVFEECLPRLFDMFYRTDEARSQSGRGSGIGLAVVKEIITAHKGEVRAENRKGLAIIMELPAMAEREQKISGKEASDFGESTDH